MPFAGLQSSQISELWVQWKTLREKHGEEQVRKTPSVNHTHTHLHMHAHTHACKRAGWLTYPTGSEEEVDLVLCGLGCLSEPTVQCLYLPTGPSPSLGHFLSKVLNSYTTQSPFVIL